MWVYLCNAALAIVAHPDRPRHLAVCSRTRGDVERIFPLATVFESPEADFRFHAILPAKEVAQRMAVAVEGIDYDRFEEALPRNDAARTTRYATVDAAAARAFSSAGTDGKDAPKDALDWPRTAYGAIFVANRVSGFRTKIIGPSPRIALLSFYARSLAGSTTVTAEGAEAQFGHLIDSSDAETASLGDWKASIYEADDDCPRRTLDEALAQGGDLSIEERLALERADANRQDPVDGEDKPYRFSGMT